MKKPKSLKGFLRLLLLVADSVPSDFNGEENISEEERGALSEILGAIQNRLGDDLDELLSKYKLEWKG